MRELETIADVWHLIFMNLKLRQLLQCKPVCKCLCRYARQTLSSSEWLNKDAKDEHDIPPNLSAMISIVNETWDVCQLPVSVRINLHKSEPLFGILHDLSVEIWSGNPSFTRWSNSNSNESISEQWVAVRSLDLEITDWNPNPNAKCIIKSIHEFESFLEENGIALDKYCVHKSYTNMSHAFLYSTQPYFNLHDIIQVDFETPFIYGDYESFNLWCSIVNVEPPLVKRAQRKKKYSFLRLHIYLESLFNEDKNIFVLKEKCGKQRLM